MRPRLVRVPMEGVSVRLDDRGVELVDISRRGVLLRLNEAPSIGSTGRIAIAAGSAVVTFGGRVVRIEAEANPDEVLVAMEILGLTPLQVASLLRPLFAVLTLQKPTGDAVESQDDAGSKDPAYVRRVHPATSN